ncbi:MAG: tRNA (adenosine(37)-N6)-threonylcarbamoyltransferase complex ATPase subunit type 1 TsaE [Ruminococcaceae bacterium]|nr:tRNA (adenosine(37)-N6)-threonylcarbamoyltransferase complex ATPase subunit type 1 TsaE [Oscillospiraceae bacterium]
MTEYISRSLEDTERIAKEIASTLEGKEVVAFLGGLGAGKTTFTRGLVSHFGVDNGVHSPTFAIVNEYQGTVPVYHFDMYRVADEDDLYSTGFYDYLGKGLVIIEWSENVLDFLPQDTIFIELSYGEEENTRIIRRK